MIPRLKTWASGETGRFLRLELRDDFALNLTVSWWHYAAKDLAHGPKTWPWWRLLSISVVRCNPHIQSNPPVWNIWQYTRCGAWCWTFAIDRRPPAQRGIA